ncbi:hypothetical protein [Microvirga tunisiensis]|uniref:Uncharacterized protein n=1 Tax=Microvirga tunisiensis TaxID=2108360 RepID=A0A5N7MTR0_9HYPH|nr:hypothetical protein [Microvirga tunisiensis]MPR12450.1 hypothetical protein [Microvirga tunisiensis]MPR30371.1 hypothetical protein [Microvirga tunisiensis]
MDHDREQAPDAETSVSDGGAEGQPHLPTEMLAEVAKHLATANPAETVKNLVKFAAVSKSAREVVYDDPAFTTFWRQLDRLRTAAKGLHSLDLPDADLDDITWAAGPTLKFLSGAEQSAVVDRILSGSDVERQALAINLMADHIGDLGGGNRTRLIERAFELFEQHNPVYDPDLPSVGSTLVRAYGYLDRDQKVRFLNAMANHPARAQYFANAVASHSTDHSNSLPPSEPAAVTQSSHLDNSITAIEASVDELIRDNTIVPDETIDVIYAVSVSINSAYDHARRELRDASRTRDRSTLAR